MSEYYEPTLNINPDAQDKENTLVNKALTKYPTPHISGLKLKADIRLGNLVLNTIDENNVVWVCTDVDGWWNLPDPEMPDLPRGWGDGSYDAKGRYASRLLTLTGAFLTQDVGQVEAARAKLIEAVSLVYRGDWLIVNETPVKGTFVRLSGKPEIMTVSPRGRTEFSIGLKAADPIKYEYVDGVEDGYRVVTITPTAGSADVVITNTGNTTVPVIIELSKNFPNPTAPNFPSITNAATDQIIEIVRGTSLNNSLEIDTYNREVLDVEYLPNGETLEILNGRAKISTLAEWIYLEPGDNTIEIDNFPANSTCTIYYRSGWIG